VGPATVRLVEGATGKALAEAKVPTEDTGWHRVGIIWFGDRVGGPVECEMT
jgi:hypothetical protein